MDKDRKLRRYNRKDYSQLVDFPVEIVGRDGVVRRYSFEESVRLYQRRIASAGMRYSDADIAQAEARHCRLRIEQLRRSYFARYGWSSIQGAEAGVGELAGEVAAFLRRCLDGADIAPESLSLSSVEEDAVRRVFYAFPRDEGDPLDERYLLYVYRFASAEGTQEREAFFDFLKALQAVRVGGDNVESLLAFHHSADCGLILTGRGRAGGAAPWSPASFSEPFEGGEGMAPPPSARLPAPDPVREGMVLLQQGEARAAYTCFTRAYEENHYRRAAYIGAAVVADQLGEHADAETAALMGSRYFSSDSVLRYHLAVARLRQGDGEGAHEVFAGFPEDDAFPSDGLARTLLGALIALRRGNVRRGRRLLNAAAHQVDEESTEGLVESLRWVRAQLAARDLLCFASGALIALGVALTWLLTPWLLVLSFFGAVLMPAIHTAWRRQLQRTLSSAGQDGLSLVVPAALQRAFERPSQLL